MYFYKAKGQVKMLSSDFCGDMTVKKESKKVEVPGTVQYGRIFHLQ